MAPSPVMATVRPRRWNAWTTRTLCAGVPRAMTRTLGSTLVERVVVQLVELGAGDDDPAVEHVELVGDRLGGARVVAGDHDDLDARPRAGRAPTACGAVAHRVGEADEAGEGQVARRRRR